MERVHCRTDGLMVLSDFDALARVAPLETEMKSTNAINPRSGICFYFTANVPCSEFWILASEFRF
jgi:hypothetical protein